MSSDDLRWAAVLQRVLSAGSPSEAQSAWAELSQEEALSTWESLSRDDARCVLDALGIRNAYSEKELLNALNALAKKTRGRGRPRTAHDDFEHQNTRLLSFWAQEKRAQEGSEQAQLVHGRGMREDERGVVVPWQEGQLRARKAAQDLQDSGQKAKRALGLHRKAKPTSGSPKKAKPTLRSRKKAIAEIVEETALREGVPRAARPSLVGVARREQSVRTGTPIGSSKGNAKRSTENDAPDTAASRLAAALGSRKPRKI